MHAATPATGELWEGGEAIIEQGSGTTDGWDVFGRETLDREALDREAWFEGFIADAQPHLRRVLVARYGVELGVDACADATAWAWEHRDRLATMSNPLGYLYRVAQTAIQRSTRWRRAPLFPGNGAAAEDELPDPDLRAALAKLNDDLRAAVMLVHAYGYRYAEAATMLDIPVSTLKSRLHRGATKLRRIMERRR